jgi:hypothetical protein
LQTPRNLPANGDDSVSDTFIRGASGYSTNRLNLSVSASWSSICC